MTALMAIATARGEGVRTLDFVLFAAVTAVAAAIGWTAASAMGGLIPAQNAMFDADTGRVLADYTGEAANYYRLKVHPWQGWLFVFYQLVPAKLLGLPPRIGVPFVNVLIATASAGILYILLRRLAVGPWTAAVHTFLFCSTAGFVFWASLPEAHMAGGASTLTAMLLMTGKPARWRSAALAVSFSMVVTNAVVWILRQIDFEPLRSGWRSFLETNRANVRGAAHEAGLSLVLVLAVWAPQWLFLRKRIGIPFNFLEERHYVEVGTKTWSSSVHVLGLLPPDSAAGLIASLAAIGVLLAALRVLPTRQWFIPLFPLFGVMLHAVYGSDSAFLFAPNYLPLFVVTLALMTAKVLPRWSGALLLPAAALLLLVNLQSWNIHLRCLDAAGQMKTYQAAVHYE
jgi:hypothetical protein